MLKANSTARWKLGSCSSLNSIERGATYQYPAIYIQRCCLDSGLHTLVCYNVPQARGWKDAYLMIDDRKYCENFVGYKSFYKIPVTGMRNDKKLQ